MRPTLQTTPPDRETLLHWERELNTMNATPCGFRHHRPDEDLPLCPGEKRSYALGCAHNYHSKLMEIVHSMEEHGFLRQEEAEQYRYRIMKGNGELTRLDFRYALEDMKPENYESTILHHQRRIIEERIAIVRELQDRVRSALETETQRA